jgi:hypothetical protein
MAGKLCLDCHWITPNPEDADPERSICSHPTSVLQVRPSPVTGKPARLVQLECRLIRQQELTFEDKRGKPAGSPIDDFGLPNDPCGPEGRHFEPQTSRGFG